MAIGEVGFLQVVRKILKASSSAEPYVKSRNDFSSAIHIMRMGMYGTPRIDVSDRCHWPLSVRVLLVTTRPKQQSMPCLFTVANEKNRRQRNTRRHGPRMENPYGAAGWGPDSRGTVLMSNSPDGENKRGWLLGDPFCPPGTQAPSNHVIEWRALSECAMSVWD
uniref:Uncharacterized protein n=1 Tax=Coccidioides posadasii RMSCC 3488 TaxID=454284 RepID=A0A0J6F4M6_COCPO|nr:hypothetical protein CPAG_00277 [Coccidioides posadasii RMSCC 3488]